MSSKHSIIQDGFKYVISSSSENGTKYYRCIQPRATKHRPEQCFATLVVLQDGTVEVGDQQRAHCCQPRVDHEIDVQVKNVEEEVGAVKCAAIHWYIDDANYFQMKLMIDDLAETDRSTTATSIWVEVISDKILDKYNGSDSDDDEVGEQTASTVRPARWVYCRSAEGY
uniref:FLYWCH-type domain-containing protein n=1 Tax=Spongospora subterranea TaxID=70186 RepID=A0A0H5R0B9_9EUKA|eukprot:CRZ07426.1 hypothetical protein [Spongospora subterranea]